MIAIASTNSAVSAFSFPSNGKTVGITQRIIQFARLLRDNNFNVDVRMSADAITVLSGCDILNSNNLLKYLKVLFCKTVSDLERFDDIYRAYWHGSVGEKRTLMTNISIAASSVVDGNTQAAGGAENSKGLAQYFEWREAAGQDGQGDVTGDALGEGVSARLSGASSATGLEGVDFGNVSNPEEAQALLNYTEQLSRMMRYRLSRRRKLSSKGREIDLRHAMRSAVSSGGFPMVLPKKSRRAPSVNTVMFVDVSGSMDSYSLFFTRFIHAAMKGFSNSQAFLFHTRLANISDAFAQTRVNVTMDKLSLMSQGWSGGTKIGQALSTFNTQYGRKYLNSKTVIFIMSDGFDTDEPKVLMNALKQLKGNGYKLIWLNPNAGRADYSPTGQGPSLLAKYSDYALPCHNLKSLLELEEVLVNV